MIIQYYSGIIYIYRINCLMALYYFKILLLPKNQMHLKIIVSLCGISCLLFNFIILLMFNYRLAEIHSLGNKI